MFTKNNIIYSEAGKVLVSKGKVGYEIPTSEGIEVHEEEINLDDMELRGSILVYSNGLIRQRYHKDFSYSDWKREIVKWRYSNDDQIAILLNKDKSEEDAEFFTKMQEWRDWASKLSKKIMEI